MSKIKSIGMRLGPAKPLLVVLAWAVSLASLGVTVITRAVLVPNAATNPAIVLPAVTQTLLVASYYLGVFGISFLSGLVLKSLGAALVGYLCSYAMAILIVGFVLYLPALIGLLPGAVAENSSLILTFTALFPFTLFVGLIGGILGGATGEA